ncbi:MAG: hypothetical protein ACUVTD_06710 [Nitrososphaerales archaeon]
MSKEEFIKSQEEDIESILKELSKIKGELERFQHERLRVRKKAQASSSPSFALFWQEVRSTPL